MGAEPDRDVVCGRGSSLGVVNLMEFAVDVEGAGRVGIPDPADHVDRLVERCDALRRGQPPSADPVHGIPVESGA